MQNQLTIKCVFCRGTGNNPHFSGTCPVCKGRGKNQVTGKYMVCNDCRWSGQKLGTTLTCYTCEGLGVVPDMREEARTAREEILKAREEIERETGRGEETSYRLEERKKSREQIDKKGYRSAIASFCGDCALGESKQCWFIKCPLASFSPVAAEIDH